MRAPRRRIVVVTIGRHARRTWAPSVRRLDASLPAAPLHFFMGSSEVVNASSEHSSNPV
jgi:hypothetical protein